MPTLPVKFFNSDMSGAPVLSGTPGALIAVLDACLVNGFDLRSAQSFVIAGGVGTINFPAAHGYIKHQVLALLGATDAQYNVAWRVTGVGAMSITVDATGFADATVASGGGLFAKVAPLGWQKAFSDTNLAAYKSTTVGASGLLLRIDDTTGPYAMARGYEAMADINTLTGPFPTLAQRPVHAWQKSSTTDNVARAWTLVGDDRFFYLIVKTDWGNNVNQRVGLAFGDLVSYKAGDAFQAMIVGGNTTAGSSALHETSGNILHRGDGNSSCIGHLARSFSQVGEATQFVLLGGIDRSGQTDMLVYPNPGDNSLLIGKGKMVVELVSKGVRGELPGYYHCLQNNPLSHGNILEDVVPGRALMVIGTVHQSGGGYETRWFIDITGPWR